MDRRVQRTRDALGDALLGLMHEKPFGDITVQQVLDLAGVGRSTFYTHYRGKDDLFLSDAEDFFEMMAGLLSQRKEKSNRVAPVREMFIHVAEWRKFYSVMVAAGKIHDVFEIGHGYFARGIERRLAEIAPTDAIELALRPALAHAYAGALLSMMSWWIHHGMPEPPERMDERYHKMVWSGLNGRSK
jgi:AcrR family transcriptional regulator